MHGSSCSLSHLLRHVLENHLLLACFINVALRKDLKPNHVRKKILLEVNENTLSKLKKKWTCELLVIQKDLCFYTGTNSIYAPISCVVVIKVDLAKSKSRMPLPCSIKETVMNGNTDTSICDVATICSDKHCFVMHCEVTSVQANKLESYNCAILIIN